MTKMTMMAALALMTVEQVLPISKKMRTSMTKAMLVEQVLPTMTVEQVLPMTVERVLPTMTVEQVLPMTVEQVLPTMTTTVEQVLPVTMTVERVLPMTKKSVIPRMSVDDQVEPQEWALNRMLTILRGKAQEWNDT
jgi:hypothetical protein